MLCVVGAVACVTAVESGASVTRLGCAAMLLVGIPVWNRSFAALPLDQIDPDDATAIYDLLASKGLVAT